MSYHQRDFYLDIAEGKQAGNYEFVRKFGYNPDVQSAEEIVWAYSGAFTWPTAAQTLDCVSSVTTDAAGQAGALTLYIEGLDANWEKQSETVTLDGTNTVTTTGSYIRVNRAFCPTVGTYGNSNLGNITIQQTTSAYIVGYIPTGYGQTAQIQYTVPKGYTFYVGQTRVSAGTGKSTDFIYYFRYNNPADSTTNYTIRKIGFAEGVAAPHNTLVTTSWPTFPGGSDLWVTAIQATGTAAVHAAIDGVLKRDRD